MGTDEVGTWNACGCQFIASAKWRYDQIPLPPHLKNKNWEDFIGLVPDTEIVLSDGFGRERAKAIKYCFDTEDISAVSNREKFLVVHNRTNNVVISGGPRTGKTMLVALIIKEVVYASILNGINLSFRYIKNSELLEKSRWDNNKVVDHEFLSDLTELNFLVIDGISDPFGHTTPPDIISLDRLFGDRQSLGRPTIFVCSDIFKAKLFSDNQYERDNILKKLGEEFYSSITNSNNIFIDLQVEGNNHESR